MSHCSMSPNGDNPVQDIEHLKAEIHTLFIEYEQAWLVAQSYLIQGIAHADGKEASHQWVLWKERRDSIALRILALTAPAGGAE